jgi:hypothetical protein
VHLALEKAVPVWSCLRTVEGASTVKPDILCLCMSFSSPGASVYGHFKPESGEEKTQVSKAVEEGMAKTMLSLFRMLFLSKRHYATSKKVAGSRPHSPILLYGVMLNWLSTGTNLYFIFVH